MGCWPLVPAALLVMCVSCTALVTGSWTVGTTGLELRISITAEVGAWDAEVLLASNTSVSDVSGRPWSTAEPVRVSVLMTDPIGEIWPLIPYGSPVRNAYETYAEASTFECTAAEAASNQVCCGSTGALVVRTLVRNSTLYQPYKLGSYTQKILTGAVRVQVTQGAQVGSIDVGINQGVVVGPFLTATLGTAAGTDSLPTTSLLIMGSDGSAFWAPDLALGTSANRVGVTDSAWRTAAAYCAGSATALFGFDNSTDQWVSFRADTLSSVCPAAEAVASIETNSANGAKSVRFEGCAGQSTAVVLLRLDARAFTLVRRFAAPVITDAGVIVGPNSPSNGGVVFVDVANRGAQGVVSVALSQCCGVGGACNGFTSDDAVSHALGTAETIRFKLAFLVVCGRGDGAYCIAELWQAGQKEGSVRVALTNTADGTAHAPDDGGPIWNGPVSQPGPIMPNSSCDFESAGCGCGALQFYTGECVVPTNQTGSATLLCGEHGKAVPAEYKCECDPGWGTITDQPAVHYLWCTQVQSPPSNVGYSKYNTSTAKLFILAPIGLGLCCCCCCAYICTNIGCKIRRCCRRRKRKAENEERKKKRKRKQRELMAKEQQSAIAEP